MSDYPGAIDSFRTPANIPGQDYDPAKTTTIFSEDFGTRSDAIVAIENTLGTNPQDIYSTVAERLAAIEARLPSNFASVAMLETSATTTDGTSVSTGSVTPSADNLIIAVVYTIGSAAPNIPTASGNGLTWVQVATELDTNSLRRVTVFRAMGASPTAGAITFDFAGQTQASFCWSIVQFSNVKTTGTNGSDALVQSVAAMTTGTATSLSCTLGALSAPNNAVFAGFGYPLNSATVTPGSGFTQVGQSHVGSPNTAIFTEWQQVGVTTCDMSISPSSVPIVGIAIEVAAS